jgi:uncharacterized protein (TIGR02996 family)
MPLAARINERVRREFFPADYTTAIRLLDRWRTKLCAPGESPSRVQTAVVRLARGRIPGLKEAIADAKVDYRDILWWGESKQFQHLWCVDGEPGEEGPAEAGFLKSIAASPSDNTIRLMYADWLEERGDLRADYLRVLCQWLACPCPDGARELIDRERELRVGLGPGWLARIRGMPVRENRGPGKREPGRRDDDRRGRAGGESCGAGQSG